MRSRPRFDLVSRLTPELGAPDSTSPDNAPMSVINGADDVHVPDAGRAFEGRRATEVHLLSGTGHCAASRLPEVSATASTWLSNTLTA